MVSRQLLGLLPRSGVVLIIGRKGSGKSCLAFAILEELHRRGRRCSAYRFPRPELLPPCVRPVREIPEDAVVLIDEAYIAADARSWRGQRNRLLGHLTGLSRQKDVLALYISQEAAKVDVNIVRGVDVLLVKPLGVTQVLFERGPLRAYLQRVREEFRHLKDPRRAVWVLSDEFEGMIREANTPPSFWSEELSCAWRGVELVEQEPRQAPVPPRWALRMVGKDDSWWRTP